MDHLFLMFISLSAFATFSPDPMLWIELGAATIILED